MTYADIAMLARPGYGQVTPIEMEAAIHAGAEWLCREAELWRSQVTLTLVAGTLTYAVEPPEGAEIVMVGRVLVPWRSTAPRWQWRAESDGDGAWSVVLDRSVVAAAGYGDWQAELVLRPSAEGHLPAGLVSRYRRELAMAAQMELRSQIGQPWGDADAHAWLGRQLVARCGQIKGDAEREGTGMSGGLVP
jgi:hypothetical protein